MIPEINSFYLINYTPDSLFLYPRTYPYFGKGRYTGDSRFDSQNRIIYFFDCLCDNNLPFKQGYFLENEILSKMS